VWDKFQALLTGAGLHARKVGGGKMRLGPFTDDDLESRQPLEVRSGELVDMNNMEPIKGGLFDQAIVGSNRWGKISLPFSVPNPAFEDSIRHLLGLTKKELRAIIAGDMELPKQFR
jgi:DNA-directed RNA polymerase beta' subunit